MSSLSGFSSGDSCSLASLEDGPFEKLRDKPFGKTGRCPNHFLKFCLVKAGKGAP